MTAVAITEQTAKCSRGTVYLLHFDRPYRHAKHYIGWTGHDVAVRLEEHRSGRGARLMAVITAAGISFQLTRTWRGSRKLERRLKTLGGAARHCPVCSPNMRWGVFRAQAVA